MWVNYSWPLQHSYCCTRLTFFFSSQGLSSTFQRGVIYCTPITAALVAQELRVRPSRIFRVPLNQPMTVEGVRVTFLNANHCPGAAMVRGQKQPSATTMSALRKP
jgi:Cft2 family RNA processing exonuclease